MKSLHYSTVVNASVEELFSYHEKDSALKRLVPPFDTVKLIHKEPGLNEGTKAHLQMKIGPFKKDWVSRHTSCDKPHGFEDEQVFGPFKSFKHTHKFVDAGSGTSEMIDEITFKNYGGFLGRWFLDRMVEKKLNRTFGYRHKTIKEDFKHFSKYDKTKKLNVLVSGASGFVGSYVCMFLNLCGHNVKRLVRKKSDSSSDVYWDVEKKEIENEKCEGMDAVIHLSGENVGSSLRWSKAKKDRIYNSRIDSTKFLVDTFNTLKQPPKKFLCTSAFGYYGVEREEELVESSEPGDSFLAKVCKDWEAAARAYTKGASIQMRFSVVMGLKGSILMKVVPVFKNYLGAILGKKVKYMSWISVDDVAYQIYHLIQSEMSGPVNFATTPITNQDFANILGGVLKRPVFCTIPEKILRILFGEMGEDLFLSSRKVIPKALNETNALISYPDFKEFLKHELGK
ncbi:MAG: hypothetical protein S4CHLAM37_06530 [Chlamydiia bacterium]|nr:hypothetical protein [Chlamydiia bacterium]